MHPGVADAEAVFAAVRAGGYVLDLIEMSAGHSHLNLPLSFETM